VGAPHRHAPLWDRRRMMATALRLLYTDHVAIDGLLGRRFAFTDAPAAFDWKDRHPQGAVKVALTY
jgi:threonine dehydrogenase-like Zn-dependent dehydrogenase